MDELEKKDLVIGAVTGYTFEQIAPWVNSLDRSGFEGIKVVLAYNVSYDLVEELTKRGYVILGFQKDDVNRRLVYPRDHFSIVVDRFLHYYLMLDNPAHADAIRYIIATDVRDVVFQMNPSVYLDRIPPSCPIELVASSEGIAYQHEPWGANNLRQSFGPIMYEKHKTNTIYNCGVLAGRFETFLDLAKSVYLLSSGTIQDVPGGGGPDQAALNLLLSSRPYRQCTEFTNHNSPWAAQLGTMMDPKKYAQFAPHFVEPAPMWNMEKEQVETTTGYPFAIVHQWDRVPMIKSAFERKYS